MSSGRDTLHFFLSSTLQSAVKIYSNLMKWAGKGQPAHYTVLERARDSAVAFSAVCLWQLLFGAQGQTRQRDTAVPWVCGRGPAARLQRPPALRDPLSLWYKPPSWAWTDRKGIYSPALSSPPFNSFHYNWMKNNPFQNNIHTGCNQSLQEEPELLKSPYCKHFWNL